MRRFLLSSAGVLASIAALVLAAVVFILPAEVERRATAALQELRLEEVTLDVVGVSLDRVQIRDLRVGRELAIDAIDLVFGPGGLLTGRIARIHILGATWHIRAGLDGADLGPFERLRTRGGESERPFERVEVRSSQVLLDVPHLHEVPVRIPLEGSIEPAGEGRFDISATLAPLRRPLSVSASVQSGARVADMRFDLRAGDAHADGALSVQGHYRREGSQRDLSVAFELRERQVEKTLLGRRWTLDGAWLFGRLTVDLARRRARVAELEARVDRLATGDAALEAVLLNVLNAAGHDDSILLKLTARGPGFVLNHLTGRFPATLAGWMDAEAFPAEISLRADPNALLPPFVRTAELGHLTLAGRGRILVAPLRLELPRMTTAMHEGFLVAGDLSLRGVRGRGTLALFVNEEGAAASIVEARAEARAVQLVDTPAALADVRAELEAPGEEPFLFVRFPDGDVEVGEIGGRATGRLNIPDLRRLPEITAYVQAKDRTLMMNAVWPISEGTALTGSGDVDLLTGAGSFGFSLPRFTLSSVPAFRSAASRLLDAGVSGDVSVQGDLRIEAGQITPKVRLRIMKGRLGLSGSHNRRAIEGIEGVVTVDGIKPLGTPGGQRIQWERIVLGQVSFGEGFVDLRVEDSRTLLVEKAEVRGPNGGTIHVGAFRIRPDRGELTFDLFCERLSLGRWLELLGGGKLTGEGRLNGHVPVRVHLGKAPTLDFGRGYLMAEPGGTLRVKDLEAAWTVLAQVGPFGEQGEFQLHQLVKARLLEALRALELDELELRLLPKGPVLDLEVHLSGRGRHGARQEIGGLTVNFHNFGAGLNQVLRFGRGATELEKRAMKEMENDPILEMFE